MKLPYTRGITLLCLLTLVLFAQDANAKDKTPALRGKYIIQVTEFCQGLLRAQYVQGVGGFPIVNGLFPSPTRDLGSISMNTGFFTFSDNTITGSGFQNAHGAVILLEDNIGPTGVTNPTVWKLTNGTLLTYSTDSPIGEGALPFSLIFSAGGYETGTLTIAGAPNAIEFQFLAASEVKGVIPYLAIFRTFTSGENNTPCVLQGTLTARSATPLKKDDD